MEAGWGSRIYVRRRSKTFPISRTTSFGAQSTMVSLTLACVAVMTPSTSWSTGKDRSNMIRGQWPTCGTAATGEILRFNGWSRFSYSHGITLQYPACRWYSMSSLNSAIALGVHTVGGGPRATAALMTSYVQSGPQSTSIPCLHSFRVGVNGCTSAKG